jgi:hypothetical protein
MWCWSASEFRHATAWPTFRLTGLGLNDCGPTLPTIAIAVAFAELPPDTLGMPLGEEE